MDRTSAAILGFGLPAIFIFVVWATAGSIYQTSSVPPPRPAPEQAEEEAPPSESAEADAVEAEQPADETAEADPSTDDAMEEEAAAAEAPANEDTAEETAAADTTADVAATEETAAAEGTTDDAADEETAAAEAPADDGAAEETAEAPADAAEGGADSAEAGIDLAALVEAGDVRAGSRLWRQCSACHVADQEQNRVGPNLVGVLGRAKASVDGFRYSDALTGLEGAWTPEAMSAWLEDPREYAPGNRMTFNGLDDAEDRADMLAYLADVQLQNGS